MSRIRPKTYARIFITCDLICLVLQAAGGAITATAGQEQDGLRQTGINIMIAGLASQLNGGFSSDLANDEVAFMILEGAMMVIACACMSAFHPGYSLVGDWKELVSPSAKSRESDDLVLTAISNSGKP
ncbi:unnamed protein product [Aspergillus oryzae]|nr:unnamed protein product [Aspergillus oryzae]